MQYTTTDLLSSIRQRGSIPTTTNTNNVNSTSNLLVLATEELHTRLLPLLMATRSEFFVAPIPDDQAVTANQSAYPISSRAVGMILRDVQLIDGSSVRSLRQIDSDQITTTSTGAVEGYYLQHNNVILYPTPSSTSGTLRLRYFVRPSRLAATSACAQISAINAVTNTVTVNSLPSTWAVGNDMDMVSGSVPYQCRVMNKAITAISGSDVTFAALPTGLAVGDWLALAEYTPIPQIPFEFQPVLAQMTVVKALEALGDNDGVKRAMNDLQILQQNALLLVTPRNHGENKKVVATRWR